MKPREAQTLIAEVAGKYAPPGELRAALMTLARNPSVNALSRVRAEIERNRHAWTVVCEMVGTAVPSAAGLED